MTPESARRAAGLLLGARRERRPIQALPADCRPASLQEGYQIQDRFVVQSADRVAGFKVGATSARAQAFLDVEGPFAGSVLSSDMHDSPAALSAGRFCFRLIEPEFALRLGRDLPPRDTPYAREEVADAIDSLHPAIEVVTSGLQDWHRQGAPSLVADNGVDGALILGPPRRDWRDFDLPNHPVTLTVNGTVVGRGVGANALGDPLIALTWLVNHQASRGRGVKSGEVVSTGVVTEFLELDAGDEAVADFGALGEVRLGFSA